MAASLLLATHWAAAQTKPDMLFQAEAQTLTGTCNGEPVRLEGNHNTLTLTGACGSLRVLGVANTVRLGIAGGGAIHVEGSGNRISYEAAGAPPVSDALGSDNEMIAAAPVQVVAKPADKPAPAAPSLPAKPAAAATPAPAGGLLLDGDDRQRLAQCAAQDVTVTGKRSAYVLRGGCKSLTVRGDLLTVRADLMPGARIAVTGRGTVVTWAVAGKGRPPAAVVHGEGSRVQHAEPEPAHGPG